MDNILGIHYVGNNMRFITEHISILEQKSRSKFIDCLNMLFFSRKKKKERNQIVHIVQARPS